MAEDKRAQEIINLQRIEESKASNFRNLYQEVADLMIPRENQIITKTVAGLDKSKQIYDPTAMLDLQDMVSGFSSAFFPTGELAFGLTVRDRDIYNLTHIKKYLAKATQITHEELFASNFMLQLNETLTSLIGFGTGCLFSEFLIEPGMPIGLNFKDWDIGFYTFLVNRYGKPDTMILKFPRTARQAHDQFGDDVGELVMKSLEKPETENEIFWFIHLVGPRKNRNTALSNNFNLPYESLYVNIKEIKIVSEGGYDELSYSICRWMLSSNEKFGRGQGTIVLSAVKELQQMHSDLIECGNKHVNQPLEVLDHFEGKVRVTPGALNWVKEKGTIRGFDQNMLGNFPYGKDILQMQQEISHRAFFADVFAPLANLPGDRRTTVEIIQRVKQATKKLALPVYRLETELFTPTLTRVVTLLIRNGRIPYPPPELEGRTFGIEYIGELALAMRDQQSKAFQQFAGLVSEFDPIFPGAKDTISMERALPDIAINFGVKTEHLATEEEIAAKRQARAQQLQQQQALQMAEVASKGYKDTRQTAEEGSPAGELQTAIAGG